MLSEVKQGSTSKAKYIYASDGTKLGVTDAGGNGYDYRGSLIYKRAANALSLESVEFSDGRITKTNSTYVPNYYITDHLGSVRVIFDASGTILEQNDYYAFGGKHLNSALTASNNRFKYNGKELQTTGNVDFLDYGARMYDTKLVRTHSQDLLQEDYYGISSYAYCFNDPVRYVDMFGLYPDDPVSSMQQNIGTVIVSASISAIDFLYFLKDRFAQWNHDQYYKQYLEQELKYGHITKKAQLEELTISLDKLKYALNGRNYKDEYGKLWNVDIYGNITGPAYVTGMAPTLGKFKGSSIKEGTVFIKGVGNVSRNVYHGIKHDILKSTNMSKIAKIVGANPNIEVSKKTGEIILNGVKQEGFLGKSYNTGLKGKDFFNNYK